MLNTNDPTYGGQNPSDPNTNSAQISAYNAAIKKQLADILALLSATPNVDPNVVARVAAVLDRANSTVDAASAYKPIEDFLKNARLAGTGLAGLSNVVGAAGVVGSSIELANGIVDHDSGAIVSGGAGYVLGVGTLTASLNGIAVVTQFAPPTAIVSLATVAALEIYKSDQNAKYTTGVEQLIDTQLGYVNQNLTHLTTLRQNGGR